MSLIYVLEDDSNIREIEEYALNASSYEVRGFETAAALREAFQEKVPDLLLLDIMLPDADGNDVLEEIRRTPETAALPVIMVTAKSTELDKVRGLDLGADDYLTKPFGVLELISRVKARLRRAEIQAMAMSGTARQAEDASDGQKNGAGIPGDEAGWAADDGKTGGSGTVTDAEAAAEGSGRTDSVSSDTTFPDGKKHLETGGIVLDDSRYEVTSGGRPVHLTFKEYSLLRLLMERADRAVTRDEILEIVWNTDFAGESRTLDMHIRSLRKKLGMEGARIRTLRNVGYTLDSGILKG